MCFRDYMLAGSEHPVALASSFNEIEPYCFEPMIQVGYFWMFADEHSCGFKSQSTEESLSNESPKSPFWVLKASLHDAP